MNIITKGFCFFVLVIFALATVKLSARTPSTVFIEGMKADDYSGITSVLVSQHGEKIFEQYFAGANGKTLHNTRSVTKTLVAMLTGIAIEKGYLSDQHQAIIPLFEDKIDIQSMDPRKKKISFEDMLTMSSLLECNDQNSFSRGHEERMYISEDWASFVVNLPIKGFPAWELTPENSPYGRAFSYCSAGSALIGIALERLVKRPLDEFAAEYLFLPLEIEHANWQSTPLGETATAGGTELTSRDLLKLGEMIAQGGVWNNKRILSESWVNSMITAHSQPMEGYAYGYQIWRFPFSYKDEVIDVWAMSGNGGNYVFFSQALSLVVVITSTNYNQGSAHAKSQKLFQNVILPVISTSP